MKSERKFAAVILMVLILLPTPLSVRAAEETPYVLCNAMERQENANSGWVAPFSVCHTVFRQDGSLYYSGNSLPQIISLRSMSETPGKAVSAYSADASTGISPGAAYRRVNLEDSTYFSDAAAGRLRSIIRCAYPQRTLAEIQEEANAWLRDRELPEVFRLQSGEAVLAAQIAIWKLTGGNNYIVHDLYGGAVNSGSSERGGSGMEPLDQRPTAYTAQNIECLYTYFSNLEPTEPQTVILSDAAVTRIACAVAETASGGYTATVTVTVSVSLGEEEKLTMTVCCGGEKLEQPVTGSGVYEFVFSELPEQGPVDLQISGMQYGEDVYLFDAEGEREAAQTLLGWHSGSLPVSCSRRITPTILP